MDPFVGVLTDSWRNKDGERVAGDEWRDGVFGGRSVLLEEVVSNGERRPVVVGLVDGTGAEIDLLELVGWLKNNQPDLLA